MGNEENTTIQFYNALAPTYNAQMKSEPSNDLVRKHMADYFIKTVAGKNILDLGGGTGKDLCWLLQNDYCVCFCEPAVNMRSIAIDMNLHQLKSDRITFADDHQSDFRNWTPETFATQFDAVLANFAVLNSIGDLPLLFQKLALVLKPGGHIIANMLDTTGYGKFKYYFKNFMVALIRNSKPVLVTRQHGIEHTAWLHTPSYLNKSSAEIFSIENVQSLNGFGFMLVHLQYQKTGLPVDLHNHYL
jgi:SAM-dependent methyltransferase